MSMYEQGAVSWAVGGAVCEALAAYAAGATTYLPQAEHVAFALDLMEIALNVHGLIETCIQVSTIIVHSLTSPAARHIPLFCRYFAQRLWDLK